MWVFLYPKIINSISYDLRGQMFLSFILLISIIQISMTVYSLVNKESQYMFCNLFFTQEAISEWKERLSAGLEGDGRGQAALLALDWKRWVWCHLANGNVNRQKRGWKRVTGRLPERGEGVRPRASEGASFLQRRAPHYLWGKEEKLQRKTCAFCVLTTCLAQKGGSVSEPRWRGMREELHIDWFSLVCPEAAVSSSALGFHQRASLFF